MTKEEAKKKIYTYAELLSMSKREFDFLRLCLNSMTFRLLGIDYKKYVKVYTDFKTNDLVIEYV